MGKEIRHVAGIGELLWDMFPTGARLGGAPLNFCYHCSQLGAQGVPVSAVGQDALGDEILDVLGSKNISDEYVIGVGDFPTGTVDVQLDENGKPIYEIKQPVAWDFISQSLKLNEFANNTDAVCFGSLAQRNEVSRASIKTFLREMKPDALKIYDINLRQDFYSEAIVRESLELCNVFKLSDEELPVAADMFSLSGTIEDQLRALIARFDLRMIAYTRGPAGSLLVAPNEVSDQPGLPGKAINSVGAGDSFSAALCIGMLEGKGIEEINEHALQVSTFVCMQDSATPELPEDVIKGVNYA
ncbi:carbohydrate kinase family protein [Pontiella sulfatireligans]|uniref:Fructokinase n=1 Tax=Pontiella sulfatireligans TaxID=2750658 RepID=A0A6C2UQU5_9BACT|nr:carbohydrate kinase [Pontiella sulfatireligans]VGO22670.1 Fructokinase [Pontiella sulfatireligans]